MAKRNNGGCNDCVFYHKCAAIECNDDCYKSKKSASMEEKIRIRKETAKFRKKIAKRGY